jgi:hypothetical protein
VPEFTRYAPPAGNFIPVPQLLSEGPWIAEFIAGIEPILANARHQSNYAPLGMQLAVALPQGTELLAGNALHSLLEPLAAAIALPQIRYAGAVKAHRPISALCIGPVGIATSDPSGWNHARARCDDVSVAAQRAFGHRIATQVTPTRWGAIRLELSIRTGILRDWVTTWKPLVESLVAILGRRRDAQEFDIEDSRIVVLSLHHDVDPLLGNAVDVEVRWRLLERLYDGPQLEYTVPDDAFLSRRTG